jgi:hypothetical protein
VEPRATLFPIATPAFPGHIFASDVPTPPLCPLSPHVLPPLRPVRASSVDSSTTSCLLATRLPAPNTICLLGRRLFCAVPLSRVPLSPALPACFFRCSAGIPSPHSGLYSDLASPLHGPFVARAPDPSPLRLFHPSASFTSLLVAPPSTPRNTTKQAPHGLPKKSQIFLCSILLGPTLPWDTWRHGSCVCSPLPASPEVFQHMLRFDPSERFLNARTYSGPHSAWPPLSPTTNNQFLAPLPPRRRQLLAATVRLPARQLARCPLNILLQP